MDSLHQNEHVQELYKILQENGKDTAGLSALINHVGEMESFVKRAEDRISDMKTQLDSIKEIQNHPFKSVLQNAIKALENQVAKIKAGITKLKNAIISGAEKAVNSFKENGVIALNNLAKFFKVESILQSVKTDIKQTIRLNDNSLSKINAFSAEYHKVGLAVKNIARIAVGKQTKDVAKEAGILAKVISAPYKLQTAILKKAVKTADKAVAGIRQLGVTAAEKTAEKPIKKPILERLAEKNELVKQQSREMKTPERAKMAGAEI
ncbi:hypothetical protein FACS1894120_1110 [Clostridia bacterium]|nr:hypothetical protein FACS1894120_1110 [Clostridia bacterium]